MAASLQKLIEEYGITSIINYLRKSRQDEEREKKTGENVLHEQKVLMDRVLSAYGVPYDQKEEIGSGDKIATRPVFQSIIKDMENGKYNAIAVKEISRMGRGSYKDMGTIYDLIVEKRIFIITPWKIYDPTNPSDLRQIRFELFMSREEFETTRERLNGGRYNAAMEGKWVAGEAPFGYDYNPHTKHLEINDEEAEIVRTIFDFYANGIVLNGKRKLVQFRALASYLNRIGLRTPQGKVEWRPIQLRRLLENDRYIGTIRYRTHKLTSDGKRIPRPKEEHIVVEDAHPPIIDMDTWNKVQDRINNRETVPRSKMDFDPCELASLCVCKKCGRKMVRQYSTQHYKKTDGTVSVYHKEFLWCTTAGCTFVKYRAVESDLLEILSYMQNLDDDLLQKNLDALVKKEEKEVDLNDIASQVEQRKAALNNRMKFIYEKYESGIYSDEEFIKRRAEIEKELEDLKHMRIEAPKEEKVQDLNLDDARKRISSLLDAYANATYKSDKNAILRSIFDHIEIEILEKGRGRTPAKYKLTPYLKFDFFAKR